MSTVAMGTTKVEKYANISSVTSYSAAGTTFVVGSITLSEVGIVVGILLGTLTFISNVVFRYLHYKLEREALKGNIDGNE